MTIVVINSKNSKLWQRKNVRDEPLKPQVSENEQMSDIVFILDKMELILQAVSKIGKDGKYSTVPADGYSQQIDPLWII